MFWSHFCSTDQMLASIAPKLRQFMFLSSFCSTDQKLHLMMATPMLMMTKTWSTLLVPLSHSSASLAAESWPLLQINLNRSKYATSGIDDHDKDNDDNDSSEDYNDDMSQQAHLMKCAGVSGMKRRQAAQMTICGLRGLGLGLGGLGGSGLGGLGGLGLWGIPWEGKLLRPISNCWQDP